MKRREALMRSLSLLPPLFFEPSLLLFNSPLSFVLSLLSSALQLLQMLSALSFEAFQVLLTFSFEPLKEFSVVLGHKRWRQWPNDPSSATRRTGRNDCNRDALAGFAAAHG
ncbi:MAG: hypothetical protein EBS84_21210 [Proteobacteria bacterium]|nr:hypothetical protein [Pseudomonadota bacterium]